MSNGPKRIVFLERGTIGPSVELKRPGFPHEWEVFDRTSGDEIVERLQGAEIAIVNKLRIGAREIAQLPDLKFISIAATGYDNIDLDACRNAGITVSNVRDYAVHTVPEHTIALIVALAKSLVGYRADVASGEWQKAGQFCFFSHENRTLHGSRIGIFGRGAIGQSVARLAEALGMEPVFAGRKGKQEVAEPYRPFEEVIETADVITVHAPLNHSTRDMIAMPEFRRMKRRPIVINTARGGLINEADTVAALEEGLIAGIGFDVLSSEPPLSDNPLLAVVDRPNVIITPHVAWTSPDAMQGLWGQVVESLEAFEQGSPVRTLT